MGRMLYRFAKRSSVAHVQRDYLRHFRIRGEGKVLDLGSGRGIFLELLRGAGIDGAGVDRDADSVRQSRALGFCEVAEADVLEFLEERARDGTRYGGILCSQLIEHLEGARGVRLVELCAGLLSPRARLVIVTPNVTNLYVWSELFWCDPTHVRPYARPLLEALVTEAGLRLLDSYADPRTRSSLLRLLAQLWRYGASAWSGVDLVVVAEKPE
jgi:2-polyprenyl-3-methyl-5-hydroxy-6-metoxy-1,4-benzoquinol methylase